MNSANTFSTLLLSGLLLVSLSACDYTTPEGGTLNVELSSTPSTLSKAVVTVEHVSISSNYDGSNPARFGGWPNMIQKEVEIDLSRHSGTGDMLLARDQVPVGDFDGLHVTFAETAELTYQDKEGNVVQKTVSLSDALQGRVALQFDRSVTLDSKDQRATVSLEFNLGKSFGKKAEMDTRPFIPSVTLKELAVNGERRTVAP